MYTIDKTVWQMPAVFSVGEFNALLKPSTRASKINDSYGKLLLIGAISLYTVQFVSNIGMSLGYFPMTSMSLPFISYGLMPILLNAFLIGVVLSVYRRKDLMSSRFNHIESGEIQLNVK